MPQTAAQETHVALRPTQPCCICYLQSHIPRSVGYCTDCGVNRDHLSNRRASRHSACSLTAAPPRMPPSGADPLRTCSACASCPAPALIRIVDGRVPVWPRHAGAEPAAPFVAACKRLDLTQYIKQDPAHQAREAVTECHRATVLAAKRSCWQAIQAAAFESLHLQAGCIDRGMHYHYQTKPRACL